MTKDGALAYSNGLCEPQTQALGCIRQNGLSGSRDATVASRWPKLKHSYPLQHQFLWVIRIESLHLIPTSFLFTELRKPTFEHCGSAITVFTGPSSFTCLHEGLLASYRHLAAELNPYLENVDPVSRVCLPIQAWTRAMTCFLWWKKPLDGGLRFPKIIFWLIVNFPYDGHSVT